MDLKDTITKIVKLSGTIDEKGRNQFAYHVKVRKECSYGIQKQEEENLEPSFEHEKGLSQRKESGYETKLTKAK